MEHPATHYFLLNIKETKCCHVIFTDNQVNYVILSQQSYYLNIKRHMCVQTSSNHVINASYSYFIILANSWISHVGFNTTIVTFAGMCSSHHSMKIYKKNYVVDHVAGEKQMRLVNFLFGKE